MKKTLWCGLVLATVLSSCMKDKNLYDEDRVSSKKQEEYNKNFPVKDLDPNQDWSTFEAIKANVTVNEDALEPTRSNYTRLTRWMKRQILYYCLKLM